MIVGEEASASEFHGTVYRSFLETLVQSLSDLTSDINEYLRLGRVLWPIYIAPVLPENIGQTLESIQRANASGKHPTNGGTASWQQRAILSLLDQKIFPHLRYALDHGVGALVWDSSAVVVAGKAPPSRSPNVPYLANYLLLAAYICQVNRPDKDKQLFSIQKNGKKRRGSGGDTGEEVAFGVGGHDRLKTLRPRTFPLERLYSLYVSMVSLNPTSNGSQNNANDASEQDGMLRSLGNVPFHETVTYLRDIGILHDYPKRSPSEAIRLSHRSFWSSITREEADAVAKSVNFALDRYLL